MSILSLSCLLSGLCVFFVLPMSCHCLVPVLSLSCPCLVPVLSLSCPVPNLVPFPPETWSSTLKPWVLSLFCKLLTRIYTENHDTSPWPAAISNTVFLSSGCTWKTRVVPEKNSNIDRESLRFIKLVLNSFLECKCPRPHIPFVKLFCLVFIVSIYVSFS